MGVVALVDERQLNGEIALFHLLLDADQQRRGYGELRCAVSSSSHASWRVAAVCDSPSTLRTELR